MPKGIYARTKKRGGWKLSKKTKEKISKYQKDRKKPKRTIQHCENISLAKKGKPRSGNPENWKHSKKAKMKMSEAKQDEKHWNWKGNKAKPSAIHFWIYKKKGKAENYICKCGKQAQDWSNRDHLYKRNLDDYIALCKSCHMKFDYQFNNRNNKRIKK